MINNTIYDTVFHDASGEKCLQYIPNTPQHKRYITIRPKFKRSGVRNLSFCELVSAGKANYLVQKKM